MIRNYFDLTIQFAHTHSILFVLIVIATLLVIFIITILLLNPKNPKMAQKIKYSSNKNESFINAQDIHAIAGEDVMVTQLDLARAYIELDKKTLAKQILQNVIQSGQHQHQTTARELLATL